MTKVTVTNPQPITIKVSSGKDQVVHTSATFLGATGDAVTIANAAYTLAVQASNTANVSLSYSSNSVQKTGDTMTGNLVLLGETTTGNLIPRSDQVYNIGTPTLRYKTLYLSGNTIDIGGGTLSAQGDTLTFGSAAGGTVSITAPSNGNIEIAGSPFAFDKANASFETANAAASYANSAYEQANGASFTANVILSYIADVGIRTDASFIQANSAYDAANLLISIVAASSPDAQAAFLQANAAFDTANNIILNYVPKTDENIGIIANNFFSITVGGIEAFAIYANNDIYLNGSIYGAPTALDGGDF